jgi:hypothetical protein
MIDDNPIVRQVARTIDGAISRAVHGADAVDWNPDSEIKRFGDVREHTLSILGRLTEEQAAWSPKQGSWSIIEIADHLLLSEKTYREQARRLLRKAEDGRGNTLEISLDEMDVGLLAIPREVVPLLEFPMRMFNLFVPSVVRETFIRYRVVSSLNPRNSQPRKGLVLAQIRRDLTTSLEETEQFLAMPMPHDLEELTFSHPIMGNNTFPQWFRIIVAHEQRHHEQMERVQALAGFPKTSQEPMNAARMSELFGGGK